MGSLVRQFATTDIAANTAFGRRHKFHEGPRGAGRVFVLGFGHRGAQIAAAAKEGAVCRFQFRFGLPMKPQP
jgi:hypothetical protein